MTLAPPLDFGDEACVSIGLGRCRCPLYSISEGLSPDWAISLILFGLVFLSFGGVGHLAFATAINASNFGVRKISFWGMTVVDSFEHSVGVMTLTFQNFYSASPDSVEAVDSLRWAMNLSGRAIGFAETVLPPLS
jgi:hypothetical protein